MHTQRLARPSLTVVMVLVLASAGTFAAVPLGTTFTYQGQLKQSGDPVNGNADLQMSLWDGPTGGSLQISGTLSSTVMINDGTFSVELDFGAGAFNGHERWIEIAVRFPAGAGRFTMLTPRQRLNAAPYALALPGMVTRMNGSIPSVIGGFAGNTVPSNVVGATISGGGAQGQLNSVSGDFGTIGGGYRNTAHQESTIGGGIFNVANGYGATIAGGVQNTASGSDSSTVGGGALNIASGSGSTVVGGAGNTASGSNSTVAGGAFNTASGLYSTVASGESNRAQGSYSFAAGRRAKANHNGAFVWGDSTNADVSSLAVNTFTARAVNGFIFYTNSGLTSGAAMGAGAGSWTSLSDRNRKRDIKPIDAQDILAKVLKLPISSWSYDSQDPSIRHIGPMAQDFNPAFGIGEFENGITTIDADGVALAAIQGLHQMIVEKDARIDTQQREISDLRARMSHIEAMLETNRGSFNSAAP